MSSEIAERAAAARRIFGRIRRDARRRELEEIRRLEVRRQLARDARGAGCQQ